METTPFVALTLLGIVLVLMMYAAQRRELRSRRQPLRAFFPPVSILKPLKGVDPSLEENLETFFRLDFPEYEVLFGVQDPQDPAVEVARRVMQRHPLVPSALVVVGHEVGYNPKVNNLAGILPHARHELVLISDSNVAVEPAMLSHMVERLSADNVGLVTSFIRGVEGRGVGGALESLQLNTFVMGGVAAVSTVLGQVCAVGKSMLMRRSVLERLGGCSELARYLAEDQVCAEKVRELGLEVTVCPNTIDNVLGRVTVRAFASRHLRWARIRRHISLPGYFGELLTNPLVAALSVAAISPGVATIGLMLGVLGVLCATSMATERSLGVRRPLHHYPVLVTLRGLVVALLWPVPLVSSSVCWRGRSYTISRRTLLQPDHPEAVDDLIDLNPGEAAA
jgi:ceramide glucosyltransferase